MSKINSGLKLGLIPQDGPYHTNGEQASIGIAIPTSQSLIQVRNHPENARTGVTDYRALAKSLECWRPGAGNHTIRCLHPKKSFWLITSAVKMENVQATFNAIRRRISPRLSQPSATLYPGTHRPSHETSNAKTNKPMRCPDPS